MTLMKNILPIIFILLFNNHLNSQRILKKIEKKIITEEYRIINDFSSLEKYRNENFQLFGMEIYNFPIEKTIEKTNNYFKEIIGTPKYIENINHIIKNNGQKFKTDGGYLNIEKVYYSLITTSHESKHVVQFYLFKMTNLKSAKDLFNLSAQGCGNSKLVYAYRNGKFVVIINCGFFNILASKIIFSIRNNFMIGQFHYPRGKEYEKNNSRLQL
jgi:hypothetical protein